MKKSLWNGLSYVMDMSLKMTPSPEKEELRSLLDAYSVTPPRLTREEFLLFAKDWVQEEKLESLLKGFDEKRVTMEEFIMWAIPPVAHTPLSCVLNPQRSST